MRTSVAKRLLRPWMGVLCCSATCTGGDCSSSRRGKAACRGRSVLPSVCRLKLHHVSTLDSPASASCSSSAAVLVASISLVFGLQEAPRGRSKSAAPAAGRIWCSITKTPSWMYVRAGDALRPPGLAETLQRKSAARNSAAELSASRSCQREDTASQARIPSKL